MGELTIPSAMAVSLRRLRSGSAMMTHRPEWATDAELMEMRQFIRASLRPAGFTTTAEHLDGVAKLIAMPNDDEARLVYVEALKDFPPDVLAKSCKSVVLSHLSQRPPTVAVFVRACRENLDYQRRLGWQRAIDGLMQKPMKEKHVRTPEEKARVLAGFEALRKGEYRGAQQ